jgi:hypothetical protein
MKTVDMGAGTTRLVSGEPEAVVGEGREPLLEHRGHTSLAPHELCKPRA